MPEVRSVSQSEINEFMDCRRRWWLHNYRKLKMQRVSLIGAAELGSRVHNALEAYYTQEDPIAELRRQRDAELQLIETGELYNTMEEVLKEHDMAETMVTGYLEWLAETGADSDIEIVSAEQRMEDMPSPLPERYTLRARYDLLIRRRSSGHFGFMDHKALTLSTRLLTPTGWITMSDVTVGTELTAPDGSTTLVRGVYPQGETDVYRVTFNDGTFAIACGDHLWQVSNSKGRSFVKSTHELMHDLDYRPKEQTYKKWSIPLVEPMKIEFRGQGVLPLHPYLLGVLLGDGGIRHSVTFSSADAELVARVESCMPLDVHLRHEPPYGYGIIKSSGYRNSVATALRDLNLMGKYSYEKAVPQKYMYASAADRLELLRGLMDTDGFVRPIGKQVVFTSTSEQLANDVAFLVRSLGGKAKVSFGGPASYTLAGVTHVCRDVWGVSIQLPLSICPFTISRKVVQFNDSRRVGQVKKIVSIVPAGRELAQCIEVDHPDMLYVIDDFVVTHNTVGSLTSGLQMLNINPQARMYALLLRIQRQDIQPRFIVWNMLLKSKRTARAKPPFYGRYEVHLNDGELQRYWDRLHGVLTDMARCEDMLLAGGDPVAICYPHPSTECQWKCDASAICAQFDDPHSDVEHILNDRFALYDPYERYNDEKKALTKS